MREKNCVECNEPLFGHHKAPEDSKLCDKCYEEIEGE